MTTDFSGPLFIIGMPRSGTKLLRSLLNNHSRIAIPSAETEFLPFWTHHWAEYGDLKNYDDFEKFYSSVIKSPYFRYMEKHNGKIISAEEWHQACDDWDVASVFESLLRLGTSCKTDMIWGDKSPSYIRHVPLLMQLYPGGKIVHIVRDVRDHCLSINKAWGKSMTRAAQRWADDVGNAQTALASFPDQMIEVRFEDLLDDPQSVLQSICNFIGITFEKQMLLLNPATENIGDALGAGEVVSGNKEKWRTRMDPKTTMKIEKICCNTLNAYNYPVSFEGPMIRIHPLKMSLLRILDGINLALHDNEKRGILKNTLLHLRHVKHMGKNP